MSPLGNSASDEQTVQIGVLGGHHCEPAVEALAQQVGRCIAQQSATLICGGRGGVMEAACRGAQLAGGRTVGILPGTDAHDSLPNSYLDVRIFTGIGQGRNLCVVLSSDVVIAIGGEWGTLSEIALARKHDIPVVLLRSWSLQPSAERLSVEMTHVHCVEGAAEAVERALECVTASRRRIFPDTV